MPKQFSPEYFDYLTKAFDTGWTKSPVITAINLLLEDEKQDFSHSKVLDVGCFSGALLNRINQLLKRKDITYFGIDNILEALKYGKLTYRDLIFIYCDINDDLPLSKAKFDIIIVSNILHEIFSDSLISNNLQQEPALSAITNALSNIKEYMSDSGVLILQEGIKPENYNKKIIVDFLTNEVQWKYQKFIEEFFIRYDSVNINQHQIETTIECISSFLTKEKYMTKDYWDQEKIQTYQILTNNNYLQVFSSLNLSIINSLFNPIKSHYYDGRLNVQYHNFQYPYKSVVYLLRKTAFNEI